MTCQQEGRGQETARLRLTKVSSEWFISTHFEHHFRCLCDSIPCYVDERLGRTTFVCQA